MPFDPPPDGPVSYYREVAKIFAFHCAGCHGEAAGLNLRTYRAVMAGGNKGKAILAGDPDNSLLIHFVEGRRGEAHRMPAGGAPLSAGQIETLRRWIRQGAREDGPLRPYQAQLAGIRMEAGKGVRITCRLPVAGFVTVSVADARTGEVLWSESASVKTPKEQNDAASPGAALRWEVRAGVDWPGEVNIDLRVDYLAVVVQSIEFTATPF